MRRSTEMNILEIVTRDSVAHRDSDFCASVFAAILAQTPSISEFVRVWGNGSPHPFSFRSQTIAMKVTIT
jgi:hypothetical protein